MKASSPPSRGLHLLAELSGCDPDRPPMRDEAELRSLLRRMVARHGLSAVGESFHRFAGDAGVTGVVVLAESHVAVHTWPERGYVTLDAFVCNHSCDNTAKAEALFAALIDAFAPGEITRHRLERG